MGKTSHASHHKEKHERSSELSQHQSDGETSARTRPFSFEEIMRKRKNKELLENVKDGDVESMFKSGDGFVNNASDDLSESQKDYKQKKDSSSPLKESAEKKKETKLTKSDKYGKQSHGESRESDIFEKQLSEQALHESTRKKEEKVEKLEKEKHRGNSDLETKWKVENRKDVNSYSKSQSEKQIRDGKIFNEREKDDFENDAATNKRSRDITGKDRHENRRRERPERESKRKYLNEEDEKIEGRNVARKHDLGKGRDFENSEKKEKQDRNAKEIHNLKSRRDLEISERNEKQDTNSKRTHDLERGRDLEISERKEKQDRNFTQKHDQGKGRDLEISERQERQDKNSKRIHELERGRNLEISEKKEKLDRNSTQKHDLGKGRDLEISEKKEKQDKDSKRTHDVVRGRDSEISEKKEKQDKNSTQKHDQGKGRDLEISERKEKQDKNSKRTHDVESRRDLDISKREEKQDKNSTQKHDQEKGHDLETSERSKRKEPSRSHYEERRLRQRRSRSREHQDKSRRSLSPKTHKRTSYHEQEHGELSSHSFKSRSGRQHSGSDQRIITRNGSGSHSRRFSGSTSGLGGYSPRKRRTEAAAKTPSPTKRSPEKKSAKWDFVPPATEILFTGSLSNIQSSYQTVTSGIDQAINTLHVPSIAIKPLNVSVDSVQLTQATRPKRRLYVDNLPDSASEKAFVEFLNKLLLSSGVNQILGTQPCISCKINKEKGQALVEFLTPEDASAALCFDGRSFSGSILKIRRPKDYVEVATGEQENPKAEADTDTDTEVAAAVAVMNDIVKDSPHKIFIGGISTALSSEMLMEIASSFGTLKAYHFEVNEDLHEQCAFLEYVDHSITLKACAALNGMKLGGQVIIAVQADPNALFLENDGDQPFYGIPEHAKPLLKNPTQVLKLKNVLSPEGLSSLSELEIEEVLEDVRLECARFGTVRSVNVVKDSDSLDSHEVDGGKESPGNRQSLGGEALDRNLGIVNEVENQSRGLDGIEFSRDTKDGKGADKIVEIDSNVAELVNDLIEDEPCKDQANCQTADGNKANENTTRTDIEPVCQDNTSKSESGNHNSPSDKVSVDTQMKDITPGNNLTNEPVLNAQEFDGKLLEGSDELDGNIQVESDKSDEADNKCDMKQFFDPGSIFVDFSKPEASCMAAHCLHGRLFDDRLVTVEYVALDLYRTRFPN